MENDQENQSRQSKKNENNNKPLITIKFPPKQQEEERRSVICPECFREFSSGKALGGHMRAHVQEKKKNQLKENQEAKLKLPDDGIYEEEPVCPICSRTFISMKSLFGHMRCHPEREWRGVQPPEAVPVVDLAVHLPAGWSVKGRRRWRRRKATIREAPARVKSLNEPTENDAEAAEALILLTQPRVEGRNWGLDKKRKMIEEEEHDDDYPAAMKRGRSSYEIGESSMTKEIAKVSMAHDELVMSRSTGNQKYRCSKCGKEFSTHQALGGHMSAHGSKFMVKIVNAASANRHLTSSPAANDHQDYGELEQPNASQIEEGEAVGSSRRMLEFDLNELPTMEEEDVEGGANS